MNKAPQRRRTSAPPSGLRDRRPTLWHIPVSHYSEKVRWALAHKGIEHRRLAPPSGAHMAIALALTRGAHKTFPVLRLDGRNIGDSSAIIAALEQHWPQPSLYPDDPVERRRALELEEYFDEQLGPQIRLLVWHELRTDPERMAVLAGTMLPGSLGESATARSAAGRFASGFSQLRFRVADPADAEAARRGVVAALDRLEAELASGEGEFLVGDSFSVADIAAASLFYPLVTPPESPAVVDPPASLERFRAPFRERPGYRWVAETYAAQRN